MVPTAIEAQKFDRKEDWLKTRSEGIGSSDAAVVLGLSRFKSPFQLFHEKLGLVEQPAVEAELAEWGLALEEPIAIRYAIETGRQVSNPGPYTLLKSKDRPFMVATVDRWVMRDPRDPVAEQDGILEIKNAHFFMGDQWTDEPPVEYQVQLQHQLAVTGLRWGSIAALIGGTRFVWADIERDDAFIEALVAEERKFWYEHVLKHTPPPVDGSAETADILKRLYPRDVGSSVALPSEALDWDAAREQALVAEEAAKAARLLAENQIKAAIGEATVGVLPNGIQYSWKAQTRKEHVVKESKYRVLRRHGNKEG